MRKTKLIPLLLCVPSLVGRLVTWAIYNPEIYIHISKHRLLIGVLIGFLNFRATQFETLAIVGVFWVIYNWVNNDG